MLRVLILFLTFFGTVGGPPRLPAEVPDELIESPLALAFGAPASAGRPRLSPDGSRLIFLQQSAPGVSMLRSLDLASGEVLTLLQGTEGGYQILWCNLSSDTRVLCDLRSDLSDRNPAYQTFVAVNLDGSGLRQASAGTGCRDFDHLRDMAHVDFLSDDSAYVLFLCGASMTLFDTYSDQTTDLSGAPDIGAAFDAQEYCDQRISVGTLILDLCRWNDMEADYAAMRGDIGRGQRLYSDGRGTGGLFWARASNRDQWFVRSTADSPWQPLLQTDPLAFDTPFRPVGYGTDLSQIYHIAWDEGTGTWALHRRALVPDAESTRVFAHELVDVELVTTMGKYNRVVAGTFLDGRSRQAIVDPRVAEVYEYVAGLLPELEVEILDESWDQSRYLARVRAPNSAGELLLVDMASESVQPIGPEYEHLTGYPLAETRTLGIESSTGGTIAVHLTLPHAMRWPEPESPVPAVILPRARPSHEEVADPHYLVQFLAANGYAVLRVNNRVEPEYGGGWLEERAIAGWRQSAEDIEDAAAWLVASGVTAADTICAAGKDYGAYQALMTAIAAPELFQCVIGMAAVADPRATPGGPIVEAALTGADGNALDQASPVRRAAEIEPPVLLFHGRNDPEVAMTEHTFSLARALEGEDKDVVFVEYPNAMHDIERGPDRIDMLARIRGFLAERIGPPLRAAEGIDEGFEWRP